MNKQDLVAQLSTTLDISRREAGEAVDTVLESIKRAVAKGEKVGIPGFGTFEARKRKARTARNPQTGAEIKVPATTVPAFKAGKEFKEAVGGKKKAAAKGGAKKSAAKKSAKKKAAKRR